jgi:hypothetical protein
VDSFYAQRVYDVVEPRAPALVVGPGCAIKVNGKEFRADDYSPPAERSVPTAPTSRFAKRMNKSTAPIAA